LVAKDDGTKDQGPTASDHDEGTKKVMYNIIVNILGCATTCSPIGSTVYSSPYIYSTKMIVFAIVSSKFATASSKAQ
jgi:hypothetical protein